MPSSALPHQKWLDPILVNEVIHNTFLDLGHASPF